MVDEEKLQILLVEDTHSLAKGAASAFMLPAVSSLRTAAKSWQKTGWAMVAASA